MIGRRSFLSLLGIGAAGIVAPVLVEPVRKQWFVSAKAPVRSRIQVTGPVIVRINGVAYGTRSADIQIGGVSRVRSMDEVTALLGEGSPLLPRIEFSFIVSRDSDLEAIRNYESTLEFRAVDVPDERFIGGGPEMQPDGSALLSGVSLHPANRDEAAVR